MINCAKVKKKKKTLEKESLWKCMVVGKWKWE